MVSSKLFSGGQRQKMQYFAWILQIWLLGNASGYVLKNVGRSITRCSDRKMTSDCNGNDKIVPTVSRKEWMERTMQVGLGAFANIASSQSADASVFFDPDRYGDKELKIATVNKLRQNIRNAVIADPSLAPQFVKVALQDALSYDFQSQEGGPSGLVVDAIVAKDAPPALKELRPAADKLFEIRKSIARTTEITMADVVTFAGAEAIESAGGPRVVVQLGKLDPKQRAPGSGTSYPELSGSQVTEAFTKSGLTEREAALLLGAIGTMESIAVSAKASAPDIEEDEPNEMGDTEVFIPTSFGAPSQIYGKQLAGNFDNSFFVSMVKSKKPTVGAFADDKVMGWVNRYASNKSGFMKDLPEAYSKAMSLGTRYTGGKVGNLLGKGDTDV